MKLRSSWRYIAIAAGCAVSLGLALFAIRGRAPPLVTASGRQLTALCAAAVQAQCDKRIECGQMDRARLPSCVDEIGAQCERSLGWKIRSGVVAIGAEPQEECIEALKAASCNALKAMLGDDDADLFELTNRCEMAEMLQPRSALGGACGDTSDCTEGHCPGLAPVCHRCSAFVPVGAPCTPGVLVCDPARALCASSALGGSTCQSVAPRALAGQPCGDGAPCAAGLFCRSTGGQRTCAAQTKTGETCVDEPGVCAELEASCVAGKCLVRPFSLGAGARCRQFQCPPGPAMRPVPCRRRRPVNARSPTRTRDSAPAGTRAWRRSPENRCTL